MNTSGILRSQPGGVFLVKLWVPLLCIIATIGIFGTDFPSWRFLFALPFILAAVFGLTLATLEVCDTTLRYRRFFQWKAIPLTQIKSATVVWPGLVGSLCLSRPIFPWGRLYFVLDQNSNPNPFGSGDYPIMQTLAPGPPQGSDSLQAVGMKAALRFYSLPFSMGAALSILVSYLTPQSKPPVGHDAHSHLVEFVRHAWQLAMTWPWGALTAALLTVMILRQKPAKHNWIVALGIGAILIQVVITAIG